MPGLAPKEPFINTMVGFYKVWQSIIRNAHKVPFDLYAALNGIIGRTC